MDWWITVLTDFGNNKSVIKIQKQQKKNLCLLFLSDNIYTRFFKNSIFNKLIFIVLECCVNCILVALNKTIKFHLNFKKGLKTPAISKYKIVFVFPFEKVN